MSDTPSQPATASSPMPPQLAQAVGYVVLHWTQIEQQVTYIVAELAGLATTEGRHAVTAELSSANRIAMVRALLSAARHRAWMDKWDALEERLIRSQAERNAVVHGTWVISQDGSYTALWRTRATRGIRHTVTEHSMQTLHDLSDTLLFLLRDINQFISEITLGGAETALRTAYRRTPLSLVPSSRTQSQSHARAAKKARRDADRLRSGAKAGDTSDAPKD